MNKPGGKLAKEIALILFGNLLLAFSVYIFLENQPIATGGVTGISLAVYKLTGLSVSVMSLILNVISWILGLILLGKKFAFGTLISTFAYPVFLWVFENTLQNVHASDNVFLCMVCGAILMGIALGLVMRQGSSTGGTDIIPMVLNKYFNFSISWVVYAVDFVILIPQFFFFPTENVLYGIIYTIVASLVLDRVLVFGNSRTEIKIISRKYEEIREKLLSGTTRGCTMLHGEGGYLREKLSVVFSVVSKRQIPVVLSIVNDIDPEALVIISEVSQVSGKGFTMNQEEL